MTVFFTSITNSDKTKCCLQPSLILLRYFSVYKFLHVVLKPIKTNHGEENSSKIHSKTCWLQTYLQFSGVRKYYEFCFCFCFFFVKGSLLIFRTVWNSSVLKVKKIYNSLILELTLLITDTHFWYAQFEFSQTFSLFLAACLTCAKTPKSPLQSVFTDSYTCNWRVCDRFTFNLP